MTGKNEQALAMAFRRALAMSAKIKELEITPDMDEEAVDAMVKFKHPGGATLPQRSVTDPDAFVRQTW